MAGDTTLTVIGNLTADPELRFTPSGAAVANFTVASTPRAFDRATGEWKDMDTLFMRCSIWRDAAENVAESLTRGTRVVVSGRLKQRSYTTKEGEERTVVELDVDEIGPSLRYAKATVTKTQRSTGGQAPGGQPDPWAGAPQGQAPQGQAPQGQGPGPRGGAPQGGPRGRGPGDPQGGPPTHQGYGQTRPDGAQQGGSPWAENPQGQLPAQQGGGSAPGWGAPGQPTYQEPPF